MNGLFFAAGLRCYPLRHRAAVATDPVEGRRPLELFEA
jgi:hypothetical protein